MTWLPEPTPSAVGEALQAVAPGLSGLPVSIPDVTGRDDPAWHMTSAALGEDYIVKFAWSQPAARFILHQIRVLEALAREPPVPFLPEVAASSTSARHSVACCGAARPAFHSQIAGLRGTG